MSDAIPDILKQADQLVSEHPQQAIELYRRVLTAEPGNLAAHNQLEQLRAPGHFGEWMRVNCRIHPDDELFRFVREYPGVHDPIRAYLADGWRTLSELMVLLERIDRPLIKIGSVLEFAAGFGRFTRHLSPLMPGRVTCSDIMPGSADFLREQFGVDAYDSSQLPEELLLPGQYELVFVLSLFTHLPVEQWGAWLEALGKRVAPGGLFVFTVHHERLIERSGGAFNDEGAFFHASSESKELDANAYGTTITTAEFVAKTVREQFGSAQHSQVRDAFWVGQDAVIVHL